MKNYWMKLMEKTRHLMGFEEAGKNVAVPTADAQGNRQKPAPFNLQSIRDEMVSNFEFQMQDNSLDDTVLFPMVCSVVLNSKDFNKRREYFHELGANAVKQFYRVIREAAEAGRCCKNMATYWTVEFVECLEGESVEHGTESIFVPEGKAITLFGVYDRLGDIKEDGALQITYSVKYSGNDDFRELNINRDMLENVNIVSDTRFHYPWNAQAAAGGKPASQHQAVTAPKRPLAVFEYMQDFEDRTFTMYGTQCRVSGLDETGRGDDICRLASKSVKAGHLTVQYLPHEQKFKLMATGETMLNDKPMELSTGTDVVWVDLPDQSEIVLGRSVILRFRKLV